MLLDQSRDFDLAFFECDVKRREPVPGHDVGIGAPIQEKLRELLAIQPRGPVEWRALGNLPMIDSLVDSRRIFTKSRLDMFPQIE